MPFEKSKSKLDANQRARLNDDLQLLQLFDTRRVLPHRADLAAELADELEQGLSRARLLSIANAIDASAENLKDIAHDIRKVAEGF